MKHKPPKPKPKPKGRNKVECIFYIDSITELDYVSEFWTVPSCPGRIEINKCDKSEAKYKVTIERV